MFRRPTKSQTHATAASFVAGVRQQLSQTPPPGADMPTEDPPELTPEERKAMEKFHPDGSWYWSAEGKGTVEYREQGDSPPAPPSLTEEFRRAADIEAETPIAVGAAQPPADTPSCPKCGVQQAPRVREWKCWKCDTIFDYPLPKWTTAAPPDAEAAT